RRECANTGQCLDAAGDSARGSGTRRGARRRRRGGPRSRGRRGSRGSSRATRGGRRAKGPARRRSPASRPGRGARGRRGRGAARGAGAGAAAGGAAQAGARGGRRGGGAAAPGAPAPPQIAVWKWTDQDFADAKDGQMPLGKATDEWIVGNVDEAMKKADLVLDETFMTQSTGHQPLETRTAMAYWQNGKLFLHGSTQSTVQT